MVVETASKVTSLIEDLYDGRFIDETTMEWLLQTPKPPREPELYTLTKIHKPKPVGRIISGCGGPTERNIGNFTQQSNLRLKYQRLVFRLHNNTQR